MFPPSLLVIPQGWGLIDLPLRASNEGSPRPRVARAQKINRLHPLPVPRAGGWPGYPSPSPRVGPDQKGTSFWMRAIVWSLWTTTCWCAAARDLADEVFMKLKRNESTCSTVWNRRNAVTTT